MLDADNVKYVLANGTGPYSDQFSRNFRHFLWIDDVIYMIDDLKTHDVGHFEWLWHPGGEAEKRGIDLNITNGNSSVVVRYIPVCWRNPILYMITPKIYIGKK